MAHEEGMPMMPLEAAAFYLERGLHPIPIPARQKAPIIENWPALTLTADELPKYFNGRPQNLGIILGDEYGTADVDLDCHEAIAAAREMLPETGMIFGRQSKPSSHYFYRSDPPIRSKRFLDPVTKACLAELRCQKSDGSIGLQTVVPPSVHPEGESIRFEPGFDKHPANVDAVTLHAAVAKVAAVSVLARHWPGEKGGRNQAFIALAGALARGGWALDQAIAFHRALYRVLWGSRADLEASKAEVIATYEKHGGGFRTTGKRSLADLVDRRVIGIAFTWLGIQAVSVQSSPPPITIPRTINMEDLMDDKTISQPELMIEAILPKCGLAVIGGRPKDGKSWFACQIALAVVTGQALGGWLRVLHHGRVQLWALEDQFALTKDKVSKLLRGTRPDGLNDLRVIEELSKPVLAGGDQIIQSTLDQHPAELVILDSLFKLTGASQPQYDVTQRDYDVLDRLRKIGVGRGCLFLIIMHTKKGSTGGNPIENLLGTSGTTAVPDALIELKRFRDGGRLTVVGRSVPAEDYEIKWHGGPTNGVGP
jgi:hypothetical protein